MCILHGLMDYSLRNLLGIVIGGIETICNRVVNRVIDFGYCACTLMCCTLVVVVICENTCRLTECGIDFGFLLEEVTRVSATSVRMGVSDVDMLLVVCRTHTTDKRGAALEHIFR